MSGYKEYYGLHTFPLDAPKAPEIKAGQQVQIKSSGRHGVVVAIDSARYRVSFWYRTGDEPDDDWFTEDEIITVKVS